MAKTVIKFERRSFSPSEAARITGVSTTLQRDWRRRAIIQADGDGKWTRYDLAEVISLYLLKVFSDIGLNLKEMVPVASMGVLPVEELIFQKSDAVYTDKGVPEDAAAMAVGGFGSSRLLVLGWTHTNPKEPEICARAENWDQIISSLEKSAKDGSPIIRTLAIDLEGIASAIVSEIDEPILIISSSQS